MPLLRRKRKLAVVAGPLCEAWEAESVGEFWPDCFHGSCWSVVTGETGT
jgi:hypothetical protein